MTVYRKKPVVIEAIQFVGGRESAAEIKAFAGDSYVCWWFNHDDIGIETLEGTMHASPGDWIIKGVKGEFYPCKPDIFELTYESVPDQGSGDLKIMGFLNESNEHAYIYADSLVVAIGRTDEGLVVDIWDSDFNEVLNSMYSYFIDGHACQEEGELL